MNNPKTLFEKVWKTHEILRNELGQSLLWVDRHFVHEGSFHGFSKLEQRALPVACPERTTGIADHYVPTHSRNLDETTSEIRQVIEKLEENTARYKVELFGLDHHNQGIVHVVGPELGLTRPGQLIVCGDSHTATHGAFGSIAFGIGASEVAHVLATQTLWQIKPKTMRITIEGELKAGVTAKDIALSIIALIGADGGRGYAVEYAGSAVTSLSIDARLTLCNLTIEGGARCGMISPDQKLMDYLSATPSCDEIEDFDTAAKYWKSLATDSDAHFDREVEIDASQILPMVTWGVSPEESLPVTQPLPSLSHQESSADVDQIHDSLDYMGLISGETLEGTAINRVFIGSCTNGRLEDLRIAASILKGRKSKVPGIVSPGSTQVKKQAEAEGLDEIFLAAGLDWVEAGCSMCVGMNGDIVPMGERCASTTNRNFKGRQGPGSRTHLMSPAMVATAAVQGCISSLQSLEE